jgi:hypothetical protein
MSIEELVQDTFHARATLVRDGVVNARSTAVRNRARAIRTRRRAAVAACAAVAVVGAAAMLRVSAWQEADGPDPAGGDRVLSVRESYAGRTLIDSAESTTGHLGLRAGSPQGVEWVAACSRVGGSYAVRLTLDGTVKESEPCSERAGLGDTIRFWVPAATAGYEHEVGLQVVRSDDGLPDSPEGVVLAVAAYALPTPYATLAGHDVYPLEENFGTEWSVLATAQSLPGERSVTLDVPVHASATMLELLSDGSDPEASVRLFVDGRRVQTVPSVYPLGGRAIGDILSGGVAHRVTLSIPEGEVPDDAGLAIVVRERAG